VLVVAPEEVGDRPDEREEGSTRSSRSWRKCGGVSTRPATLPSEESASWQ
jgi:hypothetical protein